MGVDFDKYPGAEFYDAWLDRLWTSACNMHTQSDIEKQFLLKTGQEGFEKLCSLETTKDKKGQEHSWRFSSLAPENTDGVLYEMKLPWKKIMFSFLQTGTPHDQ